MRSPEPSGWAIRKAPPCTSTFSQRAPGDEDVASAAARAARARTGDRRRRRPSRSDITIPYVLATDVVWVGAGEAFPLEAIARAIAARLGEHGAPLAARVPLLRGAVVSEQLVASFARQERHRRRPQS